MATFKTRLSQVSKTNGKVILANDYNSSEKNLQNKTIQNMQSLNTLYILMKKRTFRNTHNSTKRIYISKKRGKRKTRRKHI